MNADDKSKLKAYEELIGSLSIGRKIYPNGKNGVETRVPIPLSMDELERLQRSASMLRDVLDEAGM